MFVLRIIPFVNQSFDRLLQTFCEYFSVVRPMIGRAIFLIGFSNPFSMQETFSLNYRYNPLYRSVMKYLKKLDFIAMI